MLMMFMNPMYATSSGGELVRVGRQKAILKYDADRRKGDVNIIVANRILVQVEGKGINKDDLTAYAKMIDYKKMESSQ